MKKQHTPGPWSFVRKEQKSECCGATTSSIGYVTADNGHKEVAVLYSHEEQKANGRLIAAAPDLLAALNEIIEGVDEFWIAENPGAVDRAAAAIAKAEGEAA